MSKWNFKWILIAKKKTQWNWIHCQTKQFHAISRTWYIVHPELAENFEKSPFLSWSSCFVETRNGRKRKNLNQISMKLRDILKSSTVVRKHGCGLNSGLVVKTYAYACECVRVLNYFEPSQVTDWMYENVCVRFLFAVIFFSKELSCHRVNI